MSMTAVTAVTTVTSATLVNWLGITFRITLLFQSIFIDLSRAIRQSFVESAVLCYRSSQTSPLAILWNWEPSSSSSSSSTAMKFPGKQLWNILWCPANRLIFLWAALQSIALRKSESMKFPGKQLWNILWCPANRLIFLCAALQSIALRKSESKVSLNQRQ